MAASSASGHASPGLLSRRVTPASASESSKIFTSRSKALGPVTVKSVGTLALYCKLSIVLNTQSADKWFTSDKANVIPTSASPPFARLFTGCLADFGGILHQMCAAWMRLCAKVVQFCSSVNRKIRRDSWGFRRILAQNSSKYGNLGVKFAAKL